VVAVRAVASAELRAEEVSGLRALFDAAFHDDPLTAEDWHHAFGGIHFLVEDGGGIASHASVIARTIWTNGHRLATGYVEAVATAPSHRRSGLATATLSAATEFIDGTYRLGALATGIPGFYERLGWELWNGPTSVQERLGPRRTPEDDGAVMIHLTPSSPLIDRVGPIAIDHRPGDPW
jgi:aminoglycoside 2'-N-acetyltransferase I